MVSALGANAESLFSLNASQNALIEPRPLYSSVRARGVGDLVSIILSEAPRLSDVGTYSANKSSTLAENFTKAINTIFKTKLKDESKLRIVPTDIGYDIEYNKVELGSYGIRENEYLTWIYGTGCAEPRLSKLQKYIDHE